MGDSNAHAGDFYPRPLRGGRRQDGENAGDGIKISIHALCEEGDIRVCALSLCRQRFLSTPSARRATRRGRGTRRNPRHFYPRPLRGGRRVSSRPSSATPGFLSTPSARRATERGRRGGRLGDISIHALCEEGDITGRFGTGYTGISIHALCEEGDTA